MPECGFFPAIHRVSFQAYTSPSKARWARDEVVAEVAVQNSFISLPVTLMVMQKDQVLGAG